MNGRDYLQAYIDQNGGVPQTAARLGLPYPTFAAIANGTRGISKDMADRMAHADPLLDKARLIWVRPTKKSA